MKYFLTLFLLGSLSVFGQQVLTMYHLENLMQRDQFNPSEITKSKTNILIPLGVSFPGYSNALKFTDIFTLKGNTYLFFPDNVFNQKLRNLSNNLLETNINLDLLHIGYNLSKKAYFRFFANSKNHAEINYPDELITLFSEGWGGKNLGRTFEQEINYKATGYIEIGAGFSQSFITKAFRLGMNFKYLIGYYYGSSGSTKITFSSDKNTYESKINFNNFRIYGVGSKNKISLANINKSRGYAIDLGASYDFSINEFIPLKINASIMDIGILTYVDAPYIDSPNTENKIEKIGDLENFFSLTNFVRATSGVNQKVSQILPFKFFSSMSYELSKKSSFRISTYNVFRERRIDATHAIGYTYKTSKDKASFSVTGIKMPRESFNIGLGVRARLGSLQFYIATDTVLSYFNIVNSNVHTLRTGLNLVFGDRFYPKPRNDFERMLEKRYIQHKNKR